MGYLEGLLGGYMDRHHEIETQARLDAHNAMINQGNVYRQLLSSPDPKIKALAATGIVELGNPARKKGGLTGWMGEMETSPSYPRLMDYIRNLPETEQAAALSPTAPTQPTGGAIPATATTTAPGGPGSAALPADAVTTPGSPGPTPTVPLPAGTGVPQESGPPATLPGTPTPIPQAPAPPAAPAPDFLGARLPGMFPRVAPPTATAAGAQPVPMPEPSPGLAAPGQPAPLPQPPPGVAAPGQPVPMPQPPAGLAGPPVTAPPPSMPPILAATKEGPGATPAAGGPPTTTAQMLASPPPRPPRTFTRASVFPSPADLKSEQEQAEVTGLVSGWQEMFRLKGDPNWQENGLKAAMAQKMRAGGGGGFQAIPGETMGPDGKWRPAFGIKNGATGDIEEYLPNGQTRPFPGGFRPRTTTGSVSIGAARLAAAMEFGYNSVQEVMEAGPAAMKAVNDRAAELAAAEAGGKVTARGEAAADIPLSTAEREKSMMQLRDDWRQRSTKVMEQISSVSQMKTAWNAAVTRGDLNAAGEAMVVLWQRGIDPTSVVREAEANRPAQFSGLAARVQGWYDRVQKGGAPLTLDEMQKYVRLADEMTQAAALLVEDDRARIERIAVRQGIDPRDVVPPPLVNQPTQPGAGGATGGPPPPPQGAPVLGTPTPIPTAPGAPPLPTTPAPPPAPRPAAQLGPRVPGPTPAPGTVTLDSKVMQDPRTGKLVLVPAR